MSGRPAVQMQLSVGLCGHYVADLQQVQWTALEPHPTDMPILNDAGADLLNAQVYGATEARLTGRS